MADLYEHWWMNLTEPNCGIYYRNAWYSTEHDLNSLGYFIVYSRVLYLGESHQEYKYQSQFYLINDNEYKTYSQMHELGYSVNRSWDRFYIDTNRDTYLTGYYNPTDGYYVNSVWYATLQDLNAAGYEVGTSHTYLYGISVFHKYDVISKRENDIDYYFATNSSSWFTEDGFEINDKSWLPSVETNWTIGYYWTSDYGHGGHGAYSINYQSPYRDGVSQTKESLDALIGYQPNNTEYDCIGACMTDSMNWRNGTLTGKPLYFEYYYGGTNSRTTICSVYSSYSNAFGSNQDYSTIAVALSKDVKVIKIYDEANFAYSAFKYSHRDVDYYYILDSDAAHDHWITDIISDGYSFTERDGIIQINAVYGDDVKIPRGYDIVKAVGNCINLFPSYVGIEDGTGYLVVAYEGKDWCNPRINPRMIRQYKNIEKGHPVFRIEQIGSIRDDLLPHGQYTDTTAGTDNRNGYLELVDVKVKGTDPVYGDYYVLLKSTSTSYKSYFENGLPARCWMCIGNGWYIHEYIFNEPPDTYSFNKSTATLTWTGDPADTSDHAYWQYTDYHGASSGDHVYKFFLYAENESDRIKTVHLLCIVDGTHKTVEYWPHDGYKMGNNFYTEQELLNLGYIISRPTRQITADVTNAGESVYAYYNVTKNVTSFGDLSSYRHILTVGDEPLLYNGEADIVVENLYSNCVAYLYDMPSTVTSSVYDCVGLYSVVTSSTTPYRRFTKNAIGESLSLVICSNYSSTIYYSMPNKVNLLFFDDALPQFDQVTAIKLSTEQLTTIYYNSDVGYVVKDIGTFENEIALNNAGYIINQVYDISQVRFYFDGSNLNADTYKTRLSTNWATINDTQYVRRLYLDSALTEPVVYESGKLYYYNDSLSSMDAPGYRINNIAKFPDYTVTDNSQKTSLVNIISEHGTPNTPLVSSDDGGGLWVYDCNNKEGTNTVTIPTLYADCYRTPYEGSETFYYLENEYTLNYITTVNHLRYYRSPIGGFFTEQELLSKGYTRTPSSTALCSDTNIEFNIDAIYNVMYNSQHGYYINSHWYATVQSLNNAGYYLVEKVSKTIYLTNSTGYFAYNTGVIKTTTSFNTSYKKPYYLDEDRTQSFLWDGHKWFCDTAAQYNDTYTWRNKLRDMPESTTGDYIRLLTMITASGNPITPYVQSEINTQMYLHLATSYSSSLSTDGNIVKYLIIAYWKLI